MKTITLSLVHYVMALHNLRSLLAALDSGPFVNGVDPDALGVLLIAPFARGVAPVRDVIGVRDWG